MFYTIEGIDGAGCGVVRRALEKRLTEEKIDFTSLKYPVPNLPFGRDIYDFLDGKVEMDADVQFIAFVGQMAQERDRLKKLRKKVLVVDRYLPCTLVFQGAKGFPIKKGLKMAELFELEKPDRIFYLQLPWKVAYDRKNAEAKKSDRYESDRNLYRQTAKNYDEISTKKLFAPWTVIDATQTPEQEAEDILKIILKDLKK
jgi:thymidylate kinase